MILTKRVGHLISYFFFVYLHMFENFQLPSDSCEDKVEVLFSMDPGQVVQEQVVGWWSGIVADFVSGILVERDDKNLELFDLSYC